jgi:hypothetical protein
MAQTRAMSPLVNHIRNPHALIITPAMLDAREHRINALFWIQSDESGNATHKIAVSRQLSALSRWLTADR